MPYKPAYQRIVDDITEQVESGKLRPGDKLPSGRQLCADYGVSTMVVRTAMTILRDRGLIQGHPGVGIFIAEPE